MPPKIPILLETSQHIICNKPPFIYSQPPQNKSVYTNTVLHHLNKPYYPVHRLDFNVSGCICLAKTKQAAQKFSRNLREQGPSSKGYPLVRKYLAIVEGLEMSSFGTIDIPLDGKESKTKYQVLHEENGRKVVAVELLTGRKHQIRRHFLELGNPIVGDIKYGASSNDGAFNQPIGLHAIYMFSQVGLTKYQTIAPLSWNYRGIWDVFFRLNLTEDEIKSIFEIK